MIGLAFALATLSHVSPPSCGGAGGVRDRYRSTCCGQSPNTTLSFQCEYDYMYEHAKIRNDIYTEGTAEWYIENDIEVQYQNRMFMIMMRRNMTMSEIESFTTPCTANDNPFLCPPGQLKRTKTNIQIMNELVFSTERFKTLNQVPTKQTHDLTNKTAVIIGASAGTGFMLAVMYAQLGARVYAVARTRDMYDLNMRTAMSDGTCLGLDVQATQDGYGPVFDGNEAWKNEWMNLEYEIGSKIGEPYHLIGQECNPLFQGIYNIPSSVFDNIEFIEGDTRIQSDMDNVMQRVKAHHTQVDYVHHSVTTLSLMGNEIPIEIRNVMMERWMQQNEGLRPFETPYDPTILDSIQKVVEKSPNRISSARQSGVYDSIDYTTVVGEQIFMNALFKTFGYDNVKAHTSIGMVTSSNALENEPYEDADVAFGNVGCSWVQGQTMDGFCTPWMVGHAYQIGQATREKVFHFYRRNGFKVSAVYPGTMRTDFGKFTETAMRGFNLIRSLNGSALSASLLPLANRWVTTTTSVPAPVPQSIFTMNGTAFYRFSPKDVDDMWTLRIADTYLNLNVLGGGEGGLEFRDITSISPAPYFVNMYLRAALAATSPVFEQFGNNLIHTPGYSPEWLTLRTLGFYVGHQVHTPIYDENGSVTDYKRDIQSQLKDRFPDLDFSTMLEDDKAILLLTRAKMESVAFGGEINKREIVLNGNPVGALDI